MVSRTVTMNKHLDAFGGVAWSFAVHVTVVVPNGKSVPEAGTQLTVGLGSHASVAVGVV